MKNLVFLLLAFIAICGYGQNTGIFEGKYLVKGTYMELAPGYGYKDSIDPRTVVVVNYGNQIILRNFAGADSVIGDLNSNSFTVPKQTLGLGEFPMEVLGEGYFSHDSIFYHYFFGGIYGTFNFDCKGAKDQTNIVKDMNEIEVFLRCYPNPSSHYLNMDLMIPETVSIATLEIRQLDNRLVDLIELKNRGSFNKQINIENLSDGIFTICLLFVSFR